MNILLTLILIYFNLKSENSNNLRQLNTDLIKISIINEKLLNSSDGSYILEDNLGLKTLKNLDLSSKLINSIDEQAFKPLNQIQSLKLNNNKITELNKEIFEDLRQLEELEITYNKIPDLKANIFQNLTCLVKLNLSDNR